MGYWIIANERGNYVTETDSYGDALEYIAHCQMLGASRFQVIPYYEFYGLGSA